MPNEPQPDFEYYVKQASEQLDEQFDLVLAALQRLSERDAADADPTDFEVIRHAAKEIGRAVKLDRRVQHKV